MASYSVIGADGRAYGPVDEQGLASWVQAGRVAANSSVQCHETNQLIQACLLPCLAGRFVAAPPAVPTYAPMGYNNIVPAGSPAALAHTLTNFSGAVLVLLHFLTLGIFTMIWLQLMHDKMPKRRLDDPSAGKAIGFMFIPFFNLYWIFFANLRLIDRINEQRVGRGLPAGLRGFVLTTCILSVIPYVNYVNLLVMWPILAGLVQGRVNELVQVTAAQQQQQLAPARAMA